MKDTVRQPKPTPSTKRNRLGMTIRAVTVGAVLAGLAGVGARPSPQAEGVPDRPLNVMLLVIDSLRADKTGFGGGRWRLTPFLDDWARQCTIYDRAYAPSSWTVPVVVSMLTGQYPSEHRVTNFVAHIPSATPTLAELLSARGYATSAVGANAALRPAMGFSRGFERYAIVGEPNMLNPKADGSLIVEKTLAWVDAVGPNQPHFLYLHFMDVHMPYRYHERLAPPAGELLRTDGELNLALVRAQWEFTPAEVARLQALYDGEVRYEDALLRRFFAALRERGFLDNAVVILTADHGEEFGSHAMFGHGSSLYQEAVRVPLVVCAPDRQPGRVREPVQLAGVTASILAAAGTARPPSVRIPPLPTVDVAQAPPPTVFSELPESGHKQNWVHKQAVASKNEKLLVLADGSRVAYDLARDPAETHPRPTVPPSLDAALVSYVAGIRAGAAEQEQAAVDQATRDRLRALGYLNE